MGRHTKIIGPKPQPKVEQKYGNQVGQNSRRKFDLIIGCQYSIQCASHCYSLK